MEPAGGPEMTENKASHYQFFVTDGGFPAQGASNGLLTRYASLRVAHAPGVPGTFSPPPRVSDSDMHHGTCVTHVPWCMPGLLISGFLGSLLRGKRSRHSRRMRNPQFYVFVKRSMGKAFPGHRAMMSFFFALRTYWIFSRSDAKADRQE